MQGESKENRGCKLATVITENKQLAEQSREDLNIYLDRSTGDDD